MSSIKEIYKKYNKKLDLLDMDLIISFIIKKPIEFMLTYPETKLTKIQQEKITKLIKRRLTEEPIAYILGYKEFYGFKFKVNKNTLVPRPETEMMVDEALSQINNKKKITIADIGTGSGCIIISLAKKLSSEYPKSNFYFLGIDISKEALVVARQNAKLNKVSGKIKFLQGDLLKPIIKNSKTLNTGSKIIITANLPYLTPKQVKDSPSIKKEPKLALVAGTNGLKYYRELFKQIKDLKKIKPNIDIITLCEIDPSQAKAIKELAKKELPETKTEIKKDLAGLNRLFIIK